MFSKKNREGRDIATLIGAGTVITGDLSFRGGLHLDGRIVGDLSGEPGNSGTLTIGAQGAVEGSVIVDELVLGGRVSGDVTARVRVELGPTAQVDGNVAYGVLEMAAGARVNGRLIHQSGEGTPEPARAAALPGDGDDAPDLR